MSGTPANSIPPGQLQRMSVPDADGRLDVEARIVTRGSERWVRGVAHGWNADAVMVWWSDVDQLRRVDWLPARDVRRATRRAS